MSKMNEEKTDLKEQVDKKQFHMPRILIVYDMLVYLIAAVLLLVLYEGNDKLTTSGIFQQVVLSAGCIFVVRMAGKIYGQVWRYGGIQCYIRLLSTDAIAFIIYLLIGIMSAGRKDYICKNAFCVMSELTGSVSNPYVISLCI